ncbi:ABC transporter ATP-binding protein [Halarsenatibacter silvermanii]|uniref:Putative ABC transport system ATP-binding protein n=1 Tax=Halarsenatibacter silvermanii TaxID=321763 RepID=A0A1G9KX84_9FIRM|nr:energy-coupling factor ABC transporter ATP-binding protein [Halarsenatibacter silvermanii]SDL54338.1 putative ABC transport system ATP-binding protein [Halarsenatibacter silvermanii]
MFELQNVVYKDIIRIDDLTLARGKITVISGPSGGGKTTLLKLLINLISPDDGEIYYKGKKLEDYPPLGLRKMIKMLAQNPAMLGDTIREEFNRAAELARQDSFKDGDYRRLVGKMRLGKNLSESCDNLSGGEKQRVALARLLMLEPETLLLDEPAASLDTDNVKYLLNFLENYAEDNDTRIIMVSHVPEFANKIADQQVIIEDGELKGGKYYNGNSS